jgi:DNA-binding NarL/FixJ family response regulator
VDEVARAVKDAISEIRTISRGLSLPDIDRRSLPELVLRLAEAHKARTGVDVAVSCRIPPGIELPEAAKICIYRFVQEGLNNGWHHAEGKEQSVDLMIEGDDLRLVVADRGPGFAAPPPGAGADGTTLGLGAQPRRWGRGIGDDIGFKRFVMVREIRVVLVDDHPIYREGVARTLADAGGIDVVGQAADGDTAVTVVRDTQPDLVLLDISMPRGGGLPALARIVQLDCPPKVAMLTASEEDDDLMQALKLGALGYVLKGVGAGELVEVVRGLADGQSYVSPGLAGRLLVGLRNRGSVAANPLADLTKREEDILRLVAQGLSNREVGQSLDLQEKTVKHYMTAILQKLHVRNRVEAAMLAREHLKD